MAEDFVAGSIGGLAGILVGHPFDTVKVRLQTQSSNNALYRNTVHCFLSIIRNESITGLYKGISSPFVGVTFINAVVFGIYGNVLKQISYPDSLKSVFIAGATSGLIQSIFCCPMELVKLRMQLQNVSAQKLAYKGPMDCFLKVWSEEGIRKGIFRGLVPTMIRDAPAIGIYFMTYEYFSRIISDPIHGASTLDMLLCGGMSGVISWLSTYPLDVVKSRIQNIDGHQYSGTIDCIKKSYREGGWRIFVRGLVPTLIRAFPTNAAIFSTVTFVLRCFDHFKSTDSQILTEDQIKTNLGLFRIEHLPLFLYPYINTCFQSTMQLNEWIKQSSEKYSCLQLVSAAWQEIETHNYDYYYYNVKPIEKHCIHLHFHAYHHDSFGSHLLPIGQHC